MKMTFKKCTHLILVLAIILTQVLVITTTAYADTANLAQGKTITANNYTQTYVATNANDGNVNTYWEGASFPSTLTVDLGSSQTVYKIVLKLNPSTAWATRTQTLSVLTSTDNTNYATTVGSTTYTFNPASSNIVTITFANTTARYVRLNITANSGATGGQVAEFEVYGPGSGGGTPDLIVTDISWSPASPQTGNAVTFSATIKNQGTGATPAGTINGVSFFVDGTQVSWSDNNTSSIAAGASITVTACGGPSGSATWTATTGSHTIMAWVDDVNRMAESNESNNQYSESLTVSSGPTPSPTPTPTTGPTTTPTPTPTTGPTSTPTPTPVSSGRGAAMPFTVIEAELPTNATNGTRLAQNYKLADFAGEASGRSAVLLDANGEYVEFTLTASANALVLRNAVAENTTGTISVYANGVDKGNFTVSSKFSYVYTTPDNLGQLGYNNNPGATAYWLYEDAQLMLDTVYPAGTKIKIQKDSGDVSWIYADLLETENVAPAASNPDPTKYVQVSSTKSIDQALLEFRQDATKLGIFIPAGTWDISSKIFIYGRATQIIGAGPWWTKLQAPTGQTNTDVGFNISSDANGSTIKNLSAWGNYVYRIDGPGKFIDGNGMKNVTVDNVWIEHFICMYWGVGSSNNTFKNCRIKNTFADGINMTNGSNYNLITNCYGRGNGDDAFALFSAVDAGGSYNIGNTYSSCTAVCTRRAACFAVYGGSNNTYTNLYGADSLTYPGITISSLSFGYNTLGFGDQDCVFDGITLDRTGGDFWTSNGSDDHINNYQNFGAIWFFDGDRVFKNIYVKNVDINSPVYFGLMFQTKSPENLAMTNIRCENININNPTRYGIKFVVCAESGQGPCVGGASFTNVKINNPGVQAVYGQSGCPNFTVTKIGTGNNW